MESDLGTRTPLEQVLEKLSNAFGPPGQEDEVREVLRSELEDYADEVKVDRLGNILFHHHGSENNPHVMLTAHMDEVALFVTFIEDTGFLRIHPVGGIVDRILPGQPLLFQSKNNTWIKGIVGSKPPHLMTQEERKTMIPIEDLFVDVGASTPTQIAEKGLEIGTTGVFDVKFSTLGNGFLSGKAFDDRMGCTVLVEAFKALKKSRFNLTAVGTVQEEVGLRGARTAAWQLNPDYALALEGTFAADVPGTRPDRTSSKLKAGPVVTIMDRAAITNPVVLRTLMETGKTRKIPYQFKQVPMGGTDAGAIHLVKQGIPSGTVAVPCRYIHGPTAIAHLDDLKNTIQLTSEFVKNISNLPNCPK
ncbi:MAG: M42 family metallopeptidase [Candidatus Bathyarchaeota archaeon]|nr:MAG: M42 family metallopeptidase [Candidatus Bathyarchaeota archaeon]